MAWIRTIQEEEAHGELLDLYRNYKDPLTGRMDNIGTVHALHPEGLRAHFELYGAVMRGTLNLPGVDREAIALVVSKINGCRY